jgi:ABC-2 type transport system permease protein
MSTETEHLRLRATPPQTAAFRRGVSQRSQFTGLYMREVLRTFRNPWVLVITFVQPFMWLAFFGSSFANVPGGITTLKPLLCGANAVCLTHLTSYTQFLLPGVLATSMMTVGMFGSMSTIQDKRFGFMKRILLTPTTKSTVYLSKVLGSTTRGLVQVPVMIAAAAVFGVTFEGDALMWAGWIAGIFLLGLGMSCFFLAMTASSTDWQTPGVISNFITMPLMFASGALFPAANFPTWMQAISNVNPVGFSALLGRGVVVFNAADWSYLGYLGIFALSMLVIGTMVASRYLKAE